MYRIRFHGRGGQGMKTASRILGRAFFLAGFEVQDAPRYGAERRGAPLFAYVRADSETINERGVITRPDLVAVADDSLLGLALAGVMQGIGERTVLLLVSRESGSVWQQRLNLAGPVLVLPPKMDGEFAASRFYGAEMVGAVARLLGCIEAGQLRAAIAEELVFLGAEEVASNQLAAMAAFEAMTADEGLVQAGSAISAVGYRSPQWLALPFEPARVSAPAIHAPATSVGVHTGLWRTMRPVIDYDCCNRCWWLCSTFCPESAITVDEERTPSIDYDHCKGCMVCVAQCPTHAIVVQPEEEPVPGGSP